jgi:ATP phosphoribosyltransferase regulatory subunit
MQDTLPAACAHKRALEAQLRAQFALHGYLEAETPLLEHYDTLTGGIAQQRMWKTFDRGGRILALRPDSTTPIARMAGTALREAPLPLRLCYVQDVAQYPGDEQPRFCQSTQAGVELLGEGDADADAEVIALAAQALLAAGLRDFQIDIGQVDFFKGIMEESGLPEADQEQLRAYVEQKNMLAIEMSLRELRAGPDISRRILQLPGLYGDEEVLESARGITRSPRALAALDHIGHVLRALADYGLADRVSIDLGMVHAIHYYTGLIFRGLTGHLGRPLLSGGRYDALPRCFGRPLPAVGFALDVGQLLLALQRQGDAPAAPRCRVWIGYAPAARRDAVALARDLRAAGTSAALHYAAEPQALATAAAAHGAERAVFVDDVGRQHAVWPGGEA